MINLILFVLHQERYGGDERRVGDHGGGAEQQATYGVNTALGQRKTQHAAKRVAEADVKMVDERDHAQARGGDCAEKDCAEKGTRKNWRDSAKKKRKRAYGCHCCMVETVVLKQKICTFPKN